MNPLEYNDDRQFFSAAVRFLKEEKKYSNSKLAKAFGVRSRGYIRMILLGKREPSEHVLRKLCEILALTKIERQYVELLFRLRKSETSLERMSIVRAILRLKCFKDTRILDQDTLDYLSSPVLVILREALELKWFRALPKSKMASHLRVTPGELRQGLLRLEKMGLVKKVGPKIASTHQVLKASKSLAEICGRQFHRQMMSYAMEALDRDPSNEREFHSLTMAVSQKQFLKFKKMVHRWSEEARSQTEHSEPNVVIQFNMQLFAHLNPSRSIQ